MPRLLWPYLALLGAAGCRPARPTAALDPAHAAAITDSVTATLAAFAGRLNANDRDSLLRFYADDPRFIWAADGHAATHTVAEVHTQLNVMAGFTYSHIAYHATSVTPLAPGFATMTTEYAESLGNPTGPGFGFAGALSILWWHTPAGWKILQGHSSSATPPH